MPVKHCLWPFSRAMIYPLQESGTRPIEVFMCSIIKREGYQAGFKWITNFL